MNDKKPNADIMSASSEKMLKHLMQLREEFKSNKINVPYPLNQCSYQIAATILQASFATTQRQKIRAYKNTQVVLAKTEHFVINSPDSNRLLADYTPTLLQDLRALHASIEEIIRLLSTTPK
jgi:hypothetical protein